MRISSFITITLFLFSIQLNTCEVFSQTLASDSIWLKEQAWEKDPKTKKKMLAFEEFMKSFPEGEGELTYYVQGDSILKINEWSSTEQIIIIRDFFYKDTVLAAVHVKEFKYTVVNGVPDHRHANKLAEYLVVFDPIKKTTRNKILIVSKKGYGSREEYVKSAELYRMVYILAK